MLVGRVKPAINRFQAVRVLENGTADAMSDDLLQGIPVAGRHEAEDLSRAALRSFAQEVADAQ